LRPSLSKFWFWFWGLYSCWPSPFPPPPASEPVSQAQRPETATTLSGNPGLNPSLVRLPRDPRAAPTAVGLADSGSVPASAWHTHTLTGHCRIPHAPRIPETRRVTDEPGVTAVPARRAAGRRAAATCRYLPKDRGRRAPGRQPTRMERYRWQKTPGDSSLGARTANS
jgi:hypothetical protein